MSFEKLNLSLPVMQAVTQCGYETPTPIQAQAIPVALAGKDIIAKAPTGTGKTAAFVLPALELLLASKKRGKPQVLILAPTRELAQQITKVIYDYGKAMQIKVADILGGMPYHQQRRKLAQPVDIIVATPGRLIDCLESGGIDFSQIKLVVLDEADRMLDMGFIEEVQHIVNSTPKDRQTLLFTATTGNNLLTLAKQLQKSPEYIEIATKDKKMLLANITQRIHLTDDIAHKLKLLTHLLAEENIYKAIIFSATKKYAGELAKELKQAGHAASALHGDMNQRDRNRAIDNFRRGKTQLLVATDIAARGIDIIDLTHVINYDIPKFAEDYVHRIGRTGRAGKTGTAISFVSKNDSLHLKRIERFTGQVIPRQTISGLEPKKNFEQSAGRNSNDGGFKPKKKRYGNSSGGNKKRYGEKSFAGQGEQSSSRKRYSDRPFAAPAEQGSNKKRYGERTFTGQGEQSSSRKRYSDRPFAAPAEQGSNKKRYGERAFAGQSEQGRDKKRYSDRPFTAPAEQGNGRKRYGERSFATQADQGGSKKRYGARPGVSPSVQRFELDKTRRPNKIREGFRARRGDV